MAKGAILCDTALIAEEFSSYFAGVGETHANKIQESEHSIKYYLGLINRSEKSLFFYPTTQIEIDRTIKNLKSKSSYGLDGISNKLLKELRSELLEPLTIIFNKSLSEGCFPEKMKTASVVPLYKGKSKIEKTNYRPISLLLTISKILEKLIYTRTYNFLDSNNWLYMSQYSFRKRHSCEHAVGELVGQVVKGQATGKHTVSVFIDLSKAFDTLDHQTLLKKLEKYGIRETPNSWYSSYLENHDLVVKYANLDGSLSYSERHKVNYGVPQGSCLGLLIFLIFTNDLYLQLDHCSCILFADDTTIYYTHKNVSYIKYCIEQDLQKLSQWFKANKLTLNSQKTECVAFSSNGKPLQIKLDMNGTIIKNRQSVKFLGILIDDKLDWNIHVTSLLIKLKCSLYLLNCGRNFMSTHCMKLLYYAHFYSHLSYGISIWGSMLKGTQLQKLQLIQNKAVKIILKIKRTSSLSDLDYKKEKLLKINSLIKLENCKMGFKPINKQLPIKLTEALLTDQSNKTLVKTHHYPTRRKSTPNLPISTCKLYKTSFLSSCIREFNTLSVVTQKLEKISSFIANVKETLMHDM